MQTSGTSRDDSNSSNRFSRTIWDNTPVQSFAKQNQFTKDPTLLFCLQNLFLAISSHKKQRGVIAPKAFITKLKQENELFRSTWQQDAHEMFNFCINHIAETLASQSREVYEKLKTLEGCNNRVDGEHVKKINQCEGNRCGTNTTNLIYDLSTSKTWINSLFEGLLTNETKCLNCESVIF